MYPNQQQQIVQLAGMINQHTALLLALSAIVSAIPNKQELDKELIRKKINSKGTLTDDVAYLDSIKTSAEAHVARLLKA
jgi:hypothetical protein